MFALTLGLAVGVSMGTPIGAPTALAQESDSDSGGESNEGSNESSTDGTNSGSDSGDSSETQPSNTGGQTSDGSQSSSDGSDTAVIAIVVLGGAVVLLLLILALRARSPRTRSSSPAPSQGWRTRVERVCADGRATVDLSAALTDPAEPGSGLTVGQLRTIEGRLDLLIAELQDVGLGAPSELAGQHLRIATAHARALNDAVQTERRIKLGSVSPDGQLLEATAANLIQERTALDQSMRDISTTVASL